MNPFKKNLCITTDSYKISHSTPSDNSVGQFPAGTQYTSYYVEARTEDDETIVAGMNYVARVLEQGITVSDVQRANVLYQNHFGMNMFNYDAWMRIATEFKGKLPVKFMAAREGTLVPSKNVIAVVENTNPDYAWLPGHLETFILRSIWYATSVATKSFLCKKTIAQYLDKTSDLSGSDYQFVLNTRLHDFGARGATSAESAGLGGLAHLYSFIGTDTVEALIFAQDLFDVDCAGISIPAREHSTTVSYANEDDAYHNSIDMFGTGAYACVMDSTDYEVAVERVCIEMKDKIIEAGGTFVFRPDSGDIVKNVMYALETLGKHFGFTRNSKGYKVLNKHCRIIQGDDINSWEDIDRVLSWMEMQGWSAENVAFGMGGGLLQKVNRDTHKFAMKLSAICDENGWRGVAKCPKGSEWKASKKGKLRLVMQEDVKKTIDILQANPIQYTLLMKTYYTSAYVNIDTLYKIRQCVNQSI